jgi:pyridoxal phosphate enzyme (YggS family)
MDLTNNLKAVLQTVPNSVKLVAVSKTKPNEMIEELYKAGQRDFGENKVQDLVDKYEALPKDINWHFIGHLQTNKVKYIAPFVHLIHAVDSLKLLKEINKQALSNNRIIDVLLQFHIAEEDSKFGLKFEDCEAILDNPVFFELKNVRVIGVMGMATFTEDTTKVKAEFNKLHNFFQILKSKQFKFADYFTEISMGMSGDYQLAIEEGSTMVRVGSSIFGSR